MSLVQDQPYRLFFPLGLVLSWAGVLHWLLHGLNVLPDYRPVFHAIVQIQGFLMAFAVGFLFTAIPRRTGTPPPAKWQIVVAFVAPIGTTVAAWYQSWAVSQMFWLALVITVGSFVVRRFLSRKAGRRPPNSFVWVPMSLAIGIVGSALIAVYGILGDEYYTLHQLGKLLLLQGMFVGLIVGMGGMVLPLLLRRENSTDATRSSRHHLERAGHVVAALLLALTFWVEVYVSLRGGLLARGILVLILMLVIARIWLPPTVPGWHRWWLWLSAWMLPLGYLFAGLAPGQQKAGLHLSLIGGFGLMALTVALHVTLSHGGNPEAARGKPWQVPVYGGLLLGAILFRILVDYDPDRFFYWLACSAGLFLLGTLAWASLVLPWTWADRR